MQWCLSHFPPNSGKYLSPPPFKILGANPSIFGRKNFFLGGWWACCLNFGLMILQIQSKVTDPKDLVILPFVYAFPLANDIFYLFYIKNIFKSFLKSSHTYMIFVCVYFHIRAIFRWTLQVFKGRLILLSCRFKLKFTYINTKNSIYTFFCY